MRRIDLQNLADRKLESASILMENKHASNAYYLAGYCVEMALKAVVAKQISADTIPDKNFINRIHTHSLKDLVGLAGMKSELDSAIKNDSHFAAHWAICSEWRPESRYHEKSHAETHFLIVAISDSKHGVLPWIKKYW